ncbi:MAG: GNAT family N-acetyltransferase [Christensenella sp.]
MEKFIRYDDIVVMEINDELPNNCNALNANYMRVSLPSTYDNIRAMQAMDFTFGDRMLKVKILPARTKLDYAGLVRTKPELTDLYKEEILSIACESFLTDRRFHVAPNYDDMLARKILKCWISDIDKCFVCKVKDEVAGFLALKQINEQTVSIHLAAVRQRWRVAGIATSLYANAIQWAKEQGFSCVEGYISAANTAVLNLYSFLGGSFSEPEDVFLKEL